MPTIEVEIPGKGVAEFPEGTDELTIRKSIAETFPDLGLPVGDIGEFTAQPDAQLTETSPMTPGVAGANAETIQPLSEPPPLSAQEVEETLFEPPIRVPEKAREGITKTIAAGTAPVLAPIFKERTQEAAQGLADVAVGGAETALSPGGLMIGAAQAIPGVNVVVDAVLAGSLVKSAAKKLGEASVTGDVRLGAQGAGELLMAGAAGTASGKASVKLPINHEAVLPGASETFKEVVGEPASMGRTTVKEPNASSVEETATPVRDVLRSDEGGTQAPSGVPESVNEGGAGVRGNENQAPSKPEASVESAPQQTPAPRDWDAFYEDLVGDLDTFSPARSSGRRSYEMDDVAERFVEFARKDKTGRPPTELVKDFARQDEASAGQIRKLRASVKNVEVEAEKVQTAPIPTISNTGTDPEALKSSPVTLPSEPQQRPLGFVAPSSLSFLGGRMDAWAEPFRQAKAELSWKTFAQETLPEWTRANREVGEAGARYAAAPMVGEAMGRKFAREAMGDLANDPVFDRKLGTAIKEDNLRDIRKSYQDKADEARVKAAANPNAAEAFTEDAALYDDAARAVVTLVGGEDSPFRTEQQYRAFMDDPMTQDAIARYKQLWAEQKEPLFREASGIDPETELAGRGLETGARINLTFVREGEGAGAGAVRGRMIGGANVRQLGTLLRRDPFLRQATGTGTSYHASLSDTMADAFRREYPVAAQHEFIRKALESGIAKVGTDFRAPEGYKSYPLTLNPWRRKSLYVPKELQVEYEALAGLRPGLRIPVVTPLASILTRQSIMGLGEGTAHSANILLKLLTGITTEHPWREALVSALPGRPDAVAAVARALMRGLRPDSDGMLALAKINAAKRPYHGPISSRFLNPLDVGVRLLAKDVFKGLAEKGIVKDTETNLREFVNEVGNYTQSVQSPLVRNLRSSQVQPFATGFRTAKVQAIKRLVLAPGLEATTAMNAVALRAAILAKFVGTAATVATLNWLISGKARGYQGTPLGSVSWKDKDGRVHYFDLGAFAGATTGAKALGLAQAVEAKERGLPTTTAMAQGSRAMGTTLTSQFAGPAVRFTGIALSGKDPYGYQVADLTPEGKSDVEDIKAALQSVNPVVDVVLSYHEGKTWEEIRQRQLTRYATRTPSTLATSDKFTEVVEKKNLRDYADWLASRARKLPLADRGAFIRERLKADKVDGPSFREVTAELKRKGIYRYQ